MQLDLQLEQNQRQLKITEMSLIRIMKILERDGISETLEDIVKTYSMSFPYIIFQISPE